jgi:hypothetical protein
MARINDLYRTLGVDLPEKPQKIVTKTDISARAIINTCFEILGQNTSDISKSKEQLKNQIIRTVASAVYELSRPAKENLAKHVVEQLNNNQKDNLGEVFELTSYSKNKIHDETIAQLTDEEDDIFIKERVFTDKINAISAKIEPLFETAFSKLSDEVKNNSEKNKQTSYFFGFIYNIFSSLKELFSSEKTAKSLFNEVATICADEQKKLDLAFQEKNRLLSSVDIDLQILPQEERETFVKRISKDQGDLYKKLLTR